MSMEVNLSSNQLDFAWLYYSYILEIQIQRPGFTKSIRDEGKVLANYFASIEYPLV